MTQVPASPGSPVVDILDVGHGGCVVVRCGDDVALIDAGPGGQILEYLRTEGVKRIHTVLVSHADADHIGGLSALLSNEIQVGNVVWNGDAMKHSTKWLDLVYQIDGLKRQGIIITERSAQDDLRISLGDSRAEILVLAPGTILRQLGAGNKIRDGRLITSNTVSVVAQVIVDGDPLLLVPGDLDQVGYEHLKETMNGNGLQTKYLVLPHHGGLLGTAAQTTKTISALVDAVRPEVVFVSNGRGKFNNPRVDVVNAVRAAIPDIPIGCTQLSTTCAIRELIQAPTPGPYSAGWSRGHSCQGSTRLTVGNGIGTALDRSRHINFLFASVPRRICA